MDTTMEITHEAATITRETDADRMVDFHTHILPNLDDGSRSVRESVAMLEMEREQGVDAVVMTPHYYALRESPEQFVRKRSLALEQLIPHLTSGMPQIYMGAEVRYFEGICQINSLNSLKIEGSDLLLLELPCCSWPKRTVQEVLELNNLRAVTVVIAHIERYMRFQSPEVINRLLENGVLLQANTAFFRKWHTREKAKKMLKSGQIHFVGSDCHNEDRRKPDMGDVLKYLKSNPNNLKTNLLTKAEK